MSARYQLTEMTDTGWGQRLWTERLETAKDIVYRLGGQWRVVRQWRHPTGRWHKDFGRDNDYMLEYRERTG